MLMKLLFVLNKIMGFLTLPVYLFTIFMFFGTSLFRSSTPIYLKILALFVILVYFAVLYYGNRFIYRKLNTNPTIYITVAMVIFFLASLTPHFVLANIFNWIFLIKKVSVWSRIMKYSAPLTRGLFYYDNPIISEEIAWMY